MTTSPTAQHTTAILGELAAAICARCPDDTARIMRAETLVALGRVEPPLTGSQWLVRSETDATRVYHATARQCSCPDAQARERRCKHQYAVLLTTALEDELRYQARVARPAHPLRAHREGLRGAPAPPAVARAQRRRVAGAL